MLWTRLEKENEEERKKKEKKNNSNIRLFFSHNTANLLYLTLFLGSNLAAFRGRIGHETNNLLSK